MQLQEKTCFKCTQTKPLGEFYAHRFMADGHLNKCKACTRLDMRAARLARLDEFRERDRIRRATPERRKRKRELQKEQDRRHPEKALARKKLQRAVAEGKIAKGPCEVCGTTSNVHGHHEDYSRPLDVRWLCGTHHHGAHGTLLDEKKADLIAMQVRERAAVQAAFGVELRPRLRSVP